MSSTLQSQSIGLSIRRASTSSVWATFFFITVTFYVLYKPFPYLEYVFKIKSAFYIYAFAALEQIPGPYDKIGFFIVEPDAALKLWLDLAGAAFN